MNTNTSNPIFFVPPGINTSGFGDVLKSASVGFALAKLAGFDDFRIHANTAGRSVHDHDTLLGMLGLSAWFATPASPPQPCELALDPSAERDRALWLDACLARLRAHGRSAQAAGGTPSFTFAFTSYFHLLAALQDVPQRPSWRQHIALGGERLGAFRSVWGNDIGGRPRVLVHLRIGDVGCVQLPGNRLLSVHQVNPVEGSPAQPAFIPHHGAARYPGFGPEGLAATIRAIRDRFRAASAAEPVVIIATDGYQRTFKHFSRWAWERSLEEKPIFEARVQVLQQQHEQRLQRIARQNGAILLAGESDALLLDTIRAALTADAIISLSGAFMSSLVENLLPPDLAPVMVRSRRFPLAASDIPCISAGNDELKGGLHEALVARLVDMTIARQQDRARQPGA